MLWGASTAAAGLPPTLPLRALATMAPTPSKRPRIIAGCALAGSAEAPRRPPLDGCCWRRLPRCSSARPGGAKQGGGGEGSVYPDGAAGSEGGGKLGGSPRAPTPPIDQAAKYGNSAAAASPIIV